MNEPTREELVEIEKAKSQFLLDLDNLKPQEHIWVDRGLVLSCEGAAHPSHRVFKRKTYKVSESSDVL